MSIPKKKVPARGPAPPVSPSRPERAPGVRPWAPAGLAVLVLSCAGSPVSTRPLGEDPQGVVYGLPRTLLEFAVTVTETPGQNGRPTEWAIALAMESRLVSDPDRRYVLQRTGSFFHDDEVGIGVSAEGLLGSLTTTTSDQTLASLGELVDAGLGVVKLQALGGLGAFSLQSLKGVDAREAAEGYLSAQLVGQLSPLVGTHRCHWALPENGPIQTVFADFPAPGWSLRVQLVRVDELGAAAPTTAVRAADPSVPSEGILVRGLEPFVVSAHLEVGVRIDADPSLDALRSEARAAAEEDLRQSRSQLDVLEAVASLPGDREGEAAAKEAEALVRGRMTLQRSEEALRSLPDRIDELQERTRLALAELATERGLEPDGAGGLRLRQRPSVQDSILVADYTPITRIPLERAIFVTSTESVTLTDGVVTAQAWNRPSSGAAILGFPKTVVDKLVAIPAEIVRLRLDLSTQEQLLAAKEAQLVETRRADEDAWYNAVALARNAKVALDEAIAAGDPARIQSARATFVGAAITANAAARKIGLPIPYPEVEAS